MGYTQDLLLDSDKIDLFKNKAMFKKRQIENKKDKMKNYQRRREPHRPRLRV